MSTQELKIKISMGASGVPARRQLPNLTSKWGNCTFYINQPVADCDAWIVWGDLAQQETVVCPIENTVFFAAEPVTVHRYNREFLKQFHAIVTSDRDTSHPNPLYSQQSLPWWIGHKMLAEKENAPLEHTYDELKTSEAEAKTKVISIITSNKTFTAGHAQRLKFALELKKRLGDAVDIWGNGFNPINDKWDAIAPYKYHIAIENSAHEDYWTEKLADSILAEAYTFYYGCPNIDKYFPKKILSKIDIYDIDSSIKIINQAISEQNFEKNKQNILEAKNLILDEYQIFPHISNLCNKMTDFKKTNVTVQPESAFKKGAWWTKFFK